MRRTSIPLFAFFSLISMLLAPAASAEPAGAGIAAAARPQEATTGPRLDLDTLGSVVRIDVDGEYAGSGVVVSRDGKVLTSLDIGHAAYDRSKGRQRVTIRDLTGRDMGASAVALDANGGYAVIQMHGQIPLAARLDLRSRKIAGSDAAVCAFDEARKPVTCTFTAMAGQAVADGAAAAMGGAWPIFDRKTGALKGIMTFRTGDDGSRSPVAVLLSKLKPLIDG